MMKKKHIASIVLFCLAVTATNTYAQKVWQKIEFGLDDKIPSNERSPSGIFFRDTMNGFISANARGFRTIDGGQSWNFGNAPIPHSLFSDGYGSSFGNDRIGYYTQDNGETWSLIQPSIADPSINLNYTSSSNGGPNGTLIALAETSQQLTTPDSDTITGYNRRLLISTDAGTTWQFGDSIQLYKYNGAYYSEISRTTPFGSFPIPSDFDQQAGIIVDWYRTFDVPDSQTVRVIALVKGLKNNQPITVYYLAQIHLNLKTIEWNRLPFWQDTHPTLIDLRIKNYFRRSVDNSLFIVDHIQDTTRPGVELHYIYHSSDDGKSWASNVLPDFIDARNLNFISKYHWVAFRVSNNFFGGSVSYRTYDAGKTWQSFYHPISLGSAASGYALDSLHYYMVGAGIVVARSNDAGITWQRNTPVYVPITAVATCRDRVIVGRYHRSILRSSDRGDSWKDIGKGTEIPSGFMSLVAATFVDTARDQQSIVGIAQFSGDTSDYVAAVTTHDGGETWQIGGAIFSGYANEPQLIAIPSNDLTINNTIDYSFLVKTSEGYLKAMTMGQLGIKYQLLISKKLA